jgi:phosphopantothenoylcysteine decarboxylase / phosphopantothenate---cysteine ligase
MLAGKKILLGVSGSIAAYKSAVLTRLLVKAGAEVQVVMTTPAKEFITPLTLATLSKRPALSEFQQGNSGQWNNHVELGLWADVMVIAPASANTLAKMANGLCDNLLIATYQSARCPVFFAPAMDLDMLRHGSTVANIEKLKSFGNRLINPAHGELASGLTGFGRMAEPEEIVELLSNHFAQSGILKGKNALVTAGPTYEAIDPVRFIGNHSTGKMGYAIAETLANLGASVTLVSGPTNLSIQNGNIRLVKTTSAAEMAEASIKAFPYADITVLSAAVADYRPTTVAAQKMKKVAGAGLTLELTQTQDIAATLGQSKKPGQILVGFALETENENANAEKKLAAKNFDLIVLNSLNDKGAGFATDTNKISILDRQNRLKDFSLKSKQEVARDIVNTILEHFSA